MIAVQQINEIYLETPIFGSLTAGCCEAVKIHSWQLRAENQMEY